LELIESTDRDLTNAITTLQFNSVSTKENQKYEGRDVSLSFFHSIGKVLHNKRLEITNTNIVPSKFFRAPMKSDPSDIFSSMNVEVETFNSFVHENYTKFFLDISEVSQAMAYISDSDHLASRWEEKSLWNDYSWQISCRGIMFSQTQKPIMEKDAYKLKKPLQKLTNKKEKSNFAYVKELYRNCSILTPQNYSYHTFATELLPMLGTMQKYGKHRIILPVDNFIKSYCKYSTVISNGDDFKESSSIADFLIEYEDELLLKSLKSLNSNYKKQSQSKILVDDDIEEFDDES